MLTQPQQQQESSKPRNRIGRIRFLLEFFIAGFLIQAGASSLSRIYGIGEVVPYSVFGLGFALAIWATIRRLRDIKRSIWWVSILIAPLLLGMVLGVFVGLNGTDILDSIFVKAIGIVFFIVYLLFLGVLLFSPSAFPKEKKVADIFRKLLRPETSEQTSEALTAESSAGVEKANTLAKKTSFSMDKITKLAVITGALLAGIGVFYHYVIFLPGVERDKADKARHRQDAYGQCMEQADISYSTGWATACKNVAESTAMELKNCLSNKVIMTNPYMGASYCNRTFGVADPSPECTLPESRANSLNATYKEEQQRCATEARLGLK